ncbi:uncharacterized protein LOC125026232 [Penaeus chinensis]|uniref:uncharacterized protein LOC125026232 n=1 Tax=Penaeus chinensis TaxID=139456 RepID=UPI001FB7CD4C|nr:uncharacterized protein LOC125026232 [Penaeus chinensis]
MYPRGASPGKALAPRDRYGSTAQAMTSQEGQVDESARGCDPVLVITLKRAGKAKERGHPDATLNEERAMNSAWTTLWFVVMASAVNRDRFCEKTENTRVTGTIVFSKMMKSLMQCSGMCLHFEAECEAFTVQPENSGLICEVIKDIGGPENVAGVHTYCLPQTTTTLTSTTNTETTTTVTSTTTTVTTTTTPDPLIVDGWIKYPENRYYKSFTELDWWGSSTSCLPPSRFFIPESWNEFITVADSMDVAGVGSKQWIGAKYNETEPEKRELGTLHWADGSDNFTGFIRNDGDTSKNCAYMEKGRHELKFEKCSNTEKHLCQIIQ